MAETATNLKVVPKEKEPGTEVICLGTIASRRTTEFLEVLGVKIFLDRLEVLDTKFLPFIKRALICNPLPMRPQDMEQLKKYNKFRKKVLNEFFEHLQVLDSQNTHDYGQHSYLNENESYYTDLLRGLCEQSGRATLINKNPLSAQDSERIEREVRAYYEECIFLENDNERLLEMYIYAYLQWKNRNDYDLEVVEDKQSASRKPGPNRDALKKAMEEQKMKEASSNFQHYVKQVAKETEKMMENG